MVQQTATATVVDNTQIITGMVNSQGIEATPDLVERIRASCPIEFPASLHDVHGLFFLTMIYARLPQDQISRAATVGVVQQVIHEYGMNYWIKSGIKSLVKWDIMTEEDMDLLLPNIDGLEEQ